MMVNSTNILIPYSYVISNALLSWSDIKFGIDNKFLATNDAIIHAVNEVLETEVPSTDIESLAFLFSGEGVEPFLTNLSNLDCSSESEIREKWLYVTLKWIYEHKDTIYKKPLDLIEIIYSDFDYPYSIAQLVKYMPYDHSGGYGEEKIYKAWADYLKQKGLQYRKDLM